MPPSSASVSLRYAGGFSSTDAASARGRNCMQVDGEPNNNTPFLVVVKSWWICPQMIPLILLCRSRTWNNASLFFSAILSIQVLWIFTGW